MKRQIVTEQTIVEAGKRGEKLVIHSADAIITAAARDKAKQLTIRLEERQTPEQPATPPAGAGPKSASPPQTIAIGSDHGGFQLKEALKPFVENLGYQVVDLGTYSPDACDYPDFAYAVARMVALGKASRGIMIDAIGIASAMVANKVHGIRAACCFNELSARSSREHNDANVLTLGGRAVGVELAKSIASVWLDTNFGGGRHQQRIAKIAEIERRPQSNT